MTPNAWLMLLVGSGLVLVALVRARVRLTATKVARGAVHRLGEQS